MKDVQFIMIKFYSRVCAFDKIHYTSRCKLIVRLTQIDLKVLNELDFNITIQLIR